MTDRLTGCLTERLTDRCAIVVFWFRMRFLLIDLSAVGLLYEFLLFSQQRFVEWVGGQVVAWLDDWQNSAENDELFFSVLAGGWWHTIGFIFNKLFIFVFFSSIF